MIKKNHACGGINLVVINVNEVIKAVLNFLLFFLRKDFAGTKSTKSAQMQPSKSTKRYKQTLRVWLSH